MHPYVLFVLGAVLCASQSARAAQTPVGPTVRDVVEFKRILQPYSRSADELRQQVSPDGSRAFIVTRKADVANDKNHYEIQLLHLSPDRLSERRVPVPETVFSLDAGEDGNEASPAIQDVRWWDDRSLIFLARLKEGSLQVYRLDLPRRELVQLTREGHPIVSYAVSRDMRRLVYAVQVPNPPLRDGARSVVVGTQSFWSVKFGQQQLSAQLRKYRFFVADVGSTQAPRPLGEPFGEGNGARPLVDISPDGRWAILPRYEPERTLGWARQYPLMDELMKQFGPGLRRDPLGYFSGAMVFKARRMVAWRLDEGREQPILDAPDDALPQGGQERQDRLWQPGGMSVVLAGTHLPMPAGRGGSAASHVVEYWPDSGRWAVIATLAGRSTAAQPLDDGFMLRDDGRRRRFQRLAGGGWREVIDASETPLGAQGAWTLGIAESLNEPPDVVATSPSGHTLRLTTLNPQFDANTWGVMQPYSWRDAKGRQWDGGLMASNGTRRGARLPLVIQTYGFSPGRFYLDGPNRGNGATSAFAGRAFLREGILVLAVPLRPASGQATDDYRSLRMFNDAVRGAVGALVKEGRVDPKRVGIIGWSSMGQRVLNLITFSSLPIRAATIADGDENSLFSYTLTYGFVDTTWKHKEEINQGVPFGPTLARWVDNDASLHTDCIRSALRIESYGASVKNNWDLYAVLRRQYKPVEMIVIPGGAHALATPSERMISLQGNVDWHRYWLTGERRTDPVLALETAGSLKTQYEAWQQMATLKAADEAKPECVRPATWR